MNGAEDRTLYLPTPALAARPRTGTNADKEPAKKAANKRRESPMKWSFADQ